jgi:hypothetical protein
VTGAIDKNYNALLDKVLKSGYFENLDRYNHDPAYEARCRDNRDKNKIIEIAGLATLPNIDSINRALHAATLDFAEARKTSSDALEVQERVQAAKSFLMDFSLLMSRLLRNVLLPVVDDWIQASPQSRRNSVSQVIHLDSESKTAIELVYECIAGDIFDREGLKPFSVPTGMLKQLNLFLPATSSDECTRPNVLRFNFNEAGTCDSIDLESRHQSLIQTTSRIQYGCDRDVETKGELMWGIDSRSDQEMTNTHDRLPGGNLYLSNDDKDASGTATFQSGFDEFRNLMSEPLSPALSG